MIELLLQKLVASLMALVATYTMLLTGPVLGAAQNPQIGDVLGAQNSTYHRKDTRGRPIGSPIPTIRYAFIGSVLDESIPSNVSSKATIVREDVSKRTGHSRTFETDNSEIKVTEIISGSGQYYEDESGKWWRVGYGTTSLANFNTLPRAPEFSKDHPTGLSLIRKVFASHGDLFPDPDGGDLSTDGRATSANSDWETARDDTGTGTGSSNDLTSFLGVAMNDATNRQIVRGFFLFETGNAIGDTDTVESATFEIVCTAKNVSDNDGDDYVVVTHTQPVDDNAIVAGDYDLVEGTDLAFPLTNDQAMSEQSNTIDISGSLTCDSSTYNVFTLNSTGLSNVDITSPNVSKFGTAEGHDAQDIPITGSSGDNSYTTIMSDTGGSPETITDPKLVVIHLGGPGGETFWNFIYNFIPKALAKI